MFVNAPLDELVELAESAGLTMLQLHGEEGPAYCEEAARRSGLKVIKAARVRDASSVRGLLGVPHRLPHARRLRAGAARRHR